jgi:hypothetical protein
VPRHPCCQWIRPPIDGGGRAPLGRVHELEKQQLLVTDDPGIQYEPH